MYDRINHADRKKHTHSQTNEWKTSHMQLKQIKIIIANKIIKYMHCIPFN